MSRKLLNQLQIARFDLLVAGVGSLWLMLWLAETVEPIGRTNPAIGQLGETLAMFLGAIIAIGLVGGALWMNRAAHAAMAMFLIAVAAATLFGQTSALLALLTCAGIVMHNVIGRFVPAIGIVTIGLLYSAAMAITNPRLGFGHPIVLTMTHVMGCAVLLHLYQRKRPRINTEGGVLIGIGWAFWILLGVSLIGQRRQTVALAAEHAAMWIGPAIAMGAWFIAVTWMLRRRTDALLIQRAATLWLLLYAAGWLLGAAQVTYAIVMLVLAVLGWTGERWRCQTLRNAAIDTTYRVAG